MRKLLKRLSIGLFSTALLAAGAGLLFFYVVPRRIASNMQPPQLTGTREPGADLVYRTLDGQPRHLSATRGQVVFLNLWGTWCIQCIAEMPSVQKLYDHYRNDPDVKFLVVSRLDSPSAVNLYAHSNRLNLPFYVTENEDIPESMQLNQYPSTFIYAKDATLAAKHAGAADWSDPSVISFMDSLKRQ